MFVYVKEAIFESFSIQWSIFFGFQENICFFEKQHAFTTEFFESSKIWKNNSKHLVINIEMKFDPQNLFCDAQFEKEHFSKMKIFRVFLKSWGETKKENLHQKFECRNRQLNRRSNVFETNHFQNGTQISFPLNICARFTRKLTAENSKKQANMISRWFICASLLLSFTSF